MQQNARLISRRLEVRLGEEVASFPHADADRESRLATSHADHGAKKKNRFYSQARRGARENADLEPPTAAAHFKVRQRRQIVEPN